MHAAQRGEVLFQIGSASAEYLRHRPSLAVLLFALSLVITQAAAPDYAAVQAIFNERCLDCHAAKDPEAKLVLESFDTLTKGGQSGPVIVPGKSAESLLVKMIEGRVEKGGKKLIMPPGKRKKLGPEEIALIRGWIDTGALAPATTQGEIKELVVPKIEPKVAPRPPITALAYASAGNLIASGSYREVALRSPDSRAVVRVLPGLPGDVNALVFSADGSRLFAAAGEAGRYGEVQQWDVAEAKVIKTFRGHRDTLYALALSPDGKLLATGSYDQKIKLWSVESGQELKTLSGHNGAVFGLAFRPDGKILASASADRTVKLWDVASGERRDTLSQSLKELYAVQFAPDGKKLVAGGADNRLRVWEISEQATETTNPLLLSQFAHEGAILKLVFSSDGQRVASAADDKTVKFWQTSDWKEIFSLPSQPDWPAALAFADQDRILAVGCLDGALEYYDTGSGKPAAPAKPELVRFEPRGIQIGARTKAKVIGKHLTTVAEIHFDNPELKGTLLPAGRTDSELGVELEAADCLTRGSYEVWLSSPQGDSGKAKLFADDLPQFAAKSGPQPRAVEQIPADYWGGHESLGASETYSFSAKAGQTLVFEVAAQGLGAKTRASLTLTDAAGRVLASNNGFGGSLDPLLAYTFQRDGLYAVRVGELVLEAGTDYFYRLSVGAFPYVTAIYPLSVPVGQESQVELVGYNLPVEHSVKIKPVQPGETELPLDTAKFRSRKNFKVLASQLAEAREQEPNDLPAQATPIKVPGAVAGRISAPKDGPDADLFRFEAKAGQPWIIETEAARRGSPLDTKIEVLDAEGQPIERVLLQAVRDSAINFRPIDSNSSEVRVNNWEEMELNQYLYLQGEVVKLFRAPQGPDSAFQFYTAAGKRRTYFDTSATAHALDEPCYIVEPHAPGARLVPNGLPVFPLYYANDDDAERKLGTDSRVYFTAPKDGAYLIKVADAQGAGGDRYIYRLVVREPRPDFSVTLSGANPTVPAGSGQSFSVAAERIDGFEGEIRVEVSGLPEGFVVSTPLVIQAGHREAFGTLFALPNARVVPETNATKLTATALIGGRKITKAAGSFGRIRLAEKPKLYVALESSPGTARTAIADAAAPNWKPLELTIAPGQTVPAWLKVRRNGYDDLITFTVDNLPHGVIVDNIGLNGILIPKGENERQIFLNAARWVPDTDRLCFAIENQTGRQTSPPVLLHVRRSSSQLQARTP